MRGRAVIVIGLALAGPAGAGPRPIASCLVYVGINPSDTWIAQTVVTGRVVDYQVVLDQAACKARRQWLWRSGHWIDPREYAPRDYPGDHVSFDLLVDKVLKGQAPRKVRVTYDVPLSPLTRDLFKGPVLIGLNRTGADDTYEPGAVTMAEANCFGLYLFAATPASLADARTGKPLPVPPPPPQPYRQAGFSRYPDNIAAQAIYPPAARHKHLDGAAEADCVVSDGEALRCTPVTETPKGFGFGAAVAKLFETQAQAVPGYYKPGAHVRVSWHWRWEG